jgi:hypothetical protein
MAVLGQIQRLEQTEAFLLRWRHVGRFPWLMEKRRRAVGQYQRLRGNRFQGVEWNEQTRQWGRRYVRRLGYPDVQELGQLVVVDVLRLLLRH